MMTSPPHPRLSSPMPLTPHASRLSRLTRLTPLTPHSPRVASRRASVLDLTVGMKRTPSGFIEQHEGDARTHYSWLPTRAYRDAFGLLTYRDALPAFQPGCASGPRSVSVQNVDARRVWVPSHLVEVGSCRITAACHGRAEAYQIYHHAYDAYCQVRSTLTRSPLTPSLTSSLTPSLASPRLLSGAPLRDSGQAAAVARRAAASSSRLAAALALLSAGDAISRLLHAGDWRLAPLVLVSQQAGAARVDLVAAGRRYRRL